MGWLSGWAYRRAVTITNNTSTELTDFQVRIELNSSNFDFSKANADGSDIRFTKDDGETLLKKWKEVWDPSNQRAVVWVKVPSIPANGETTVYLYYGNSEAVDDDDPDNVFEVFDDFTSDPGINITKNDSSGLVGVITSLNPSEPLYSFALESNIELVNVRTSRYGCYGIILSGQGADFSFESDTDDGTPPLARVDGESWQHIDWGGHRITFKRNGANMELYIDGSLLQTSGNGDADTPFSEFKVGAGGSATNMAANLTWDGSRVDFYVARSGSDAAFHIYFDWVAVRKFAEQEPSVSVGSEETPSIPVKVWDGSQWINVKAVKVWDGSAWVDAKAIYVWDGSSWVKL